ncbi:hypothetical protein FRC06_007334 [Ceratobasidium sp. 370]|nr:hypothetical protein FRC06_007334 [Ceratobasidium sp. 370]
MYKWYHLIATPEAQLLGAPPTLHTPERVRSVAVACTGTPISRLKVQVAHPGGPRVKILQVPPPLPGSSDDTNNTTNTAGPVVDKHPYDHPYYKTPTSYEERTTKNGCCACGGHARGQDGSVQLTFIKLLGDCKSKYDYTAAHMHPFATLHGLSHFNPYSAIKAERECYSRVPKPKGLAGGPGRGGETKLHEELGLRMDVQFYNQGFQGTVKQALHKFMPKNLELGAKITWDRYSAVAQRQVYKYCYDLILAFQHFRDQTGKDCWAVALITQQYLQGKAKLPSLDDNSATSRKAAWDLRPNLEEYKDDYTTNAPAYCMGPNAPNPRAAPAHASHPQPPPANPPRA